MTSSSKRLHGLALSDSGFIFDPETGQAFTANELGLEIIRLLKEGRTFEEIVADIENRYDAGYDLVYKDVAQFLSQLKTSRWLDEN
jgi:hypothetical protein